VTVPAIRVGYSPDADDAFMLAGLESGAVVARDLRLSFETAAKRLSADTMTFSAASSSLTRKAPVRCHCACTWASTVPGL